ncbi:NAD-dependent epimerase/dehydratase family protein, partial [Pseudomonas syringae]
MHILLTGGTGLIGRQLCKPWLAQGHRLTVWS